MRSYGDLSLCTICVQYRCNWTHWYGSSLVAMWYWKTIQSYVCLCPPLSSVDIWSVGCIMAEMLLGKPLFKGNDRILFQCLLLSVFTPHNYCRIMILPGKLAELYVINLSKTSSVSLLWLSIYSMSTMWMWLPVPHELWHLTPGWAQTWTNWKRSWRLLVHPLQTLLRSYKAKM